MGSFCKRSVEEAIESLKADGVVRTKEEFWLKLSQETRNPQTGKIFKPHTLRKYVNRTKPLKEKLIIVIKDGARALNVELELMDDRVQPFVMDASFLNVEYQIFPKDRTKNRIEPYEQSEGTHGVTLRRGFKTVRFGEDEDETELYSVQLIPDRCQVQIVTRGQAKFEEAAVGKDPTPFRFLGSPEDPAVTQWDVSGISSIDVVKGTLGTFSGTLTEIDAITVLIDENDLAIGEIKNTIDSQTLPVGDDKLAKRVSEQRKRVLVDALKDNASGQCKLVVRPLLESD